VRQFPPQHINKRIERAWISRDSSDPDLVLLLETGAYIRIYREDGELEIRTGREPRYDGMSAELLDRACPQTMHTILVRGHRLIGMKGGLLLLSGRIGAQFLATGRIRWVQTDKLMGL